MSVIPQGQHQPQPHSRRPPPPPPASSSSAAAASVPLPTFSGRLGSDDFHIWAIAWIAWLRVHNVPDSDSAGSDDAPVDQEAAAAANALRNDFLLLALEKGSIAQRYLLSLPPEYRTSWKHAMSCLQRRFATPARMDMARQAARNALSCRGFRDDQHRGESVQQLVDDFEELSARAGLVDDSDLRFQFLWMFRKYTAATRMLQRSTTLEEAFLEAFRWEKVLVEKTGTMAAPGSESSK